jgi:hypothetical protein
MRTPLLISWRLSRFEYIALGIVAVVVSAGALFVAWQLNQRQMSAECYVYLGGGPIEGSASRDCPRLDEFLTYSQEFGRKIMAAMGLLPFAVGAVLGAPVVARELEQRTAVLAWSLTPSRSRWLLERLAPPLIVLMVVLGLPAIAANVLEHASNPSFDPSATFRDYGLRGPLVVMRGLVIFAAGALLGALVGRLLPTLILTAAFAVFVSILLPLAAVFGQSLDALSVNDVRAQGQSSLLVDSAWRDGDGRILTEAEARKLSPYVGDPESTHQWLIDNFDDVNLVILGDRYPAVELRESLILGAASLLLVGLSVVAVQRRRPA